jgi:cation diffusion facilitator CzcD-associated flavoprotein CzcO
LQGAGPSGIVAAKTLIHDSPKETFHVTVFEVLNRIGGLWPVSKDDDGFVNPEMCTNQSKHTVNFSGLAWPETTAVFPKAWQVGQYLERYIDKYPGYTIQKNTRVVKSQYKDGKWMIQTRKNDGQNNIESHVFDHLIVATGFFGQPLVPKILDGFPAPVIHSSQFRSLRVLLSKTSPSSPVKRGKKIVVVGGQMSGVEVAAAIATQLSSEENSPGEAIPQVSEYAVTHVIPNPVWVMPLFLPRDPLVIATGDEKVT